MNYTIIVDGELRLDEEDLSLCWPFNSQRKRCCSKILTRAIPLHGNKPNPRDKRIIGVKGDFPRQIGRLLKGKQAVLRHKIIFHSMRCQAMQM